MAHFDDVESSFKNNFSPQPEPDVVIVEQNWKYSFISNMKSEEDNSLVVRKYV